MGLANPLQVLSHNHAVMFYGIGNDLLRHDVILVGGSSGLFATQVTKGTTKTLALELGSPASPVILGSRWIESKVQHFTVLWVCQHCNITHRISIDSDDALDLYQLVSRCVVADRCQPLPFAFEELHLSNQATYGLREHDG
jgi:hypothetical protein